MGTKRVCSCALRSTWNIRGRYGETRGGSLVITRLVGRFQCGLGAVHIGWLRLARAGNAGAARGRRVRHDLPTGFLFLFDCSCRS